MTNAPEETFVKLSISEDNLTATLRITDFSLPTRDLLKLIKNLLDNSGIKFGLKPARLKEMVLQKKTNTPVVIAEGIPPGPSEPPVIERLIEFDPASLHAADEKGRINYKELKRTNIIEKDTPLLRISPGKLGTPGKTVTGTVVEAKPIALESVLKPGENVGFSDKESDTVIALADGLAVLSPAGKLDVLTTLNIEQDIDYDTGNIHFPGKVLIQGDIKSGFEVHAGEDVEVMGTVEDAKIEAGRDIIVHRGFAGNFRGLLKAGRNINVSFAHNQNLEAKQNLTFEIELIGCRAKVGGAVKSSSGRIVGGNCEAVESIEISLAGSEEEIKTRLIVGKKGILLDEKNNLEKQISEISEKMKKFKNEIYQMVVLKLDGKLGSEDEEKLNSFQKEKDNLSLEVEKLESRISEIDEKIGKLKNSFIKINGVIFPGSEFKVGGSSWMNKEKRRYLTVREIDQRIRIFPN